MGWGGVWWREVRGYKLIKWAEVGRGGCDDGSLLHEALIQAAEEWKQDPGQGETPLRSETWGKESNTSCEAASRCWLERARHGIGA